MIFDNLKELVIPEGNVVKIEHAGRVLWEKIIYTIQTITGINSITIPEVANYKGGIVEITQYGKTEQDGTPTPSTPVDIKCNNGTVRMVHRSGLPSGYRLLEYVGSNGSRYVLTDLYLASTDVVECEFKNSTTTGYGAIYGVFKLGESSAFYANQTYYGYDADNNKVDTGIHIDTEWHSLRHDFVNGTLTIDDTTITFAPFEFENSIQNAVLSRYYNNSYGYNWKGYVRKFKVTRNGEVVCDLLPAKNNNDVAGLYDLVTGNFYTATGGELLEGNEVDDYELIVDGTPEVLFVASQTASAADLFAVGDYKDEQDIIHGVITRRVGVKVLDGTENWGAKNATSGQIITRVNDMLNQSSVPLMVTHGEWSASAMKDSDEWRIVVGPYLACFSSQETTADFKAWLADQYAQGTPVIVVYPLAEETTDSTTPQTITASGTTTISADSNYISDIGLKVDYYGIDE